MTDDQQAVDEAEKQVDHDEEYAEAYGFWMLVFGIVGAIVGYNIGAAAGFGFWPNAGLGVLGVLVLASVAFKFRKIVATIGAVLIVMAIIAAVVEGFLGA